MRKGYVLLLTVLSVGIITSTVAIVILLLGLSIERNAYSLQISTQAYEFSQTCIEEAIQRLRDDLEYEGNEIITVGIGPDSSVTGECTIRPITGYWNTNRTICTEAIYGNYTKRRQVVQIDTVLPDTKITDWQEVSHISECPEYSEPTCGNSIIETGEQCDTGGDSTTCNEDCTFASCGDGYTNASYISPLSGLVEQCDTEGESTSCDLNCTTATCGDGDVNTARNEDCDTAGQSASCNTDCTDAVCGDGKINAAAGETCDGNGAGVGGETVTCDTDCTARSCGDGVINVTAGEECDGGPLCNGSCLTVSITNPTDYIAYWRLDESSGTAVDAVAARNCSASGGAGVSTQIPTAISGSPVTSVRSRDFDGNNDFLQCPNDNALSPSPNISVSFWVRADSAATYDGIICATNSSWTNGWGFYFDSSTQISFFVEDWWTNKAIGTVTATNWNHIVGTWDGNSIRIFVNGSLRSTDTYYGSMTRRRPEIGRCASNSYNLDGRIDDVRIYNRVLTNDEITALATGT
jgi:Concanavalin A-like lectin/glucanases superfamily